MQDIINDEEKRKKLVVYINPPYAEAASSKTVSGTGKNKANTSLGNKTNYKYKGIIGKASNELFTQFLTRIYAEIPNSKIANFSTLKNLQSSNFKDFRLFFRAKLEKIFIVPAETFDNVKGKFPIGFFIWNSDLDEIFNQIDSDIYNIKSEYIGQKKLTNFDNLKYINSWYNKYYDNSNYEIGIMNTRGNDFQNQNYIRISSTNNFNHTNIITKKNLISSSIYISVRHCINANWLNDRDQFLHPNEHWQNDTEFQNDCLVFTLFDNSNNISGCNGTNHWIPFTEQEVNAKEKFASSFMTDFIKGKIKKEEPTAISLFDSEKNSLVPNNNKALVFSDEATAVFDSGRELWKYYHSQHEVNVNASLYDIREYFQGRNDKGRMNPRSQDATYTALIGELRKNLTHLAEKIKPKVYEYEFLKE